LIDLHRHQQKHAYLLVDTAAQNAAVQQATAAIPAPAKQEVTAAAARYSCSSQFDSYWQTTLKFNFILIFLIFFIMFSIRSRRQHDVRQYDKPKDAPKAYTIAKSIVNDSI